MVAANDVLCTGEQGASDAGGRRGRQHRHGSWAVRGGEKPICGGGQQIKHPPHRLSIIFFTTPKDTVILNIRFSYRAPACDLAGDGAPFRLQGKCALAGNSGTNTNRLVLLYVFSLLTFCCRKYYLRFEKAHEWLDLSQINKAHRSMLICITLTLH
jgi:hypothetical protein